MQLADLEARGRLTRSAGRHHRHRRRRRRPARTRRWCGSSRRPTPPSRSPTSRRSRAAAHDAGAYVVVDNTFATPLRPAAADAWAPTSSCTRRRSTSPATPTRCSARVVTPDDQLYDVLKGRRDLVGAIPGTFEAWLALRGLRTLHLRVERAESNAPELVRPPAASTRAVDEVRYPGFGGDRLDRARRRRRTRPTCCRAVDVTVGARHLARRRRVDVRAAPPVEVRAGHHPGRRWCGSASASRTSRTCGPTCRAGASTAPGRRACRTSEATRAGHDRCPVARCSPVARSPLVPRGLRRSVALGLGVAGDERLHHLRGGHPAVDDGLDVLGDRGVDADLARPAPAATSRTSRPRRPGGSRRRSPRWSCRGRASRRTSGCATAARSRWRPGRRGRPDPSGSAGWRPSPSRAGRSRPGRG